MSIEFSLRVCACGRGGGGVRGAYFVLKALLIRNLILSKTLLEPVITLRPGTCNTHINARTYVQ